MSRLSAIKERDKNAPDNSNCFTVDIKKWILQHSTFYIKLDVVIAFSNNDT